MPYSLQPHGLKHARFPHLSMSHRICSNSWPLCQWCHPTTSASATPFSLCLQSSPAWGSFPMSQLFTLDGQSIGASASTMVLIMHIQGWFPLGVTGLISMDSKDSQESSRRNNFDQESPVKALRFSPIGPHLSLHWSLVFWQARRIHPD